MEKDEEVRELKVQMEKQPFKPIESPIVSLIKRYRRRKLRKKEKEIEELRLDIEKAKLEKELKEVNG